MEEKKYTAEQALNLQAAAYQKGFNEGYELCKKGRPEMEDKHPGFEYQDKQFIPAPPTTTGTYFALIKPYVGDEQQLCVLHYQSHNGIYRAAGHAFNLVVQAEDVVGYMIPQEQQGAVWVRAKDRLPGYEIPVKWRDGNDHSHSTERKIPLIHMAKPFLTGWEWFDEGV